MSLPPPDGVRAARELLEGFATAEPARAVAFRTVRGEVMHGTVSGGDHFPAASLVKVPLAFAVMRAGAEGRVDLAREVTRADLPEVPGPSVLAVLRAEHRLGIDELVGLLLATSDNRAAPFLLDIVGLEACQAATESLGAPATVLRVTMDGDHAVLDPLASSTTADDALAMIVTIATAIDGVAAELRGALRNNVRSLCIPLGVAPGVEIVHKTGSMPGVAHDTGVLVGRSTDLAVAFFSRDQQDTLLTSYAIGMAVAGAWSALGEQVVRGWSAG